MQRTKIIKLWNLSHYRLVLLITKFKNKLSNIIIHYSSLKKLSGLHYTKIEQIELKNIWDIGCLKIAFIFHLGKVSWRYFGKFDKEPETIRTIAMKQILEEKLNLFIHTIKNNLKLINYKIKILKPTCSMRLF